MFAAAQDFSCSAAVTLCDLPRQRLCPPRRRLRTGDLVADKYLVAGVVGEGGVGIVFAARDLQEGRDVAIKVLRPEFGDDADAVARFRWEARTVARLRGDHVVRCFGEGTLEGGSPYMVMELLEGCDLGQLMERRGARFGVAEALDYVLQACEALSEAHASGITHRDLKPENLFVTTSADGRPFVKLIDFGMSSSVELAQALATKTSVRGTLMGSPAYMSPEHVNDFESVDARSDVWALGVVLFELLTGTLLYDEASIPSMLKRICREPIPSLRTRRVDLPRRLERVVRRCLAKERSRRFQSAAQLARALRPFAAPAR